VLVGVSKDSLESHKRFAEKYDLDCYLLADPDGSILALLGLEKVPGGRAKRSTFVVDKSGIIRKIFENVTVRGHADEVLAAVRAL
jgi:thioredoxin-dependent peroxiredoxin